MKTKKLRKLTLVTFSQSVFLNVKFFLQNRLLSYAGACSFSMLFSLVPVFMLVIAVLIKILHTSPESLTAVLNAVPQFKGLPSEPIIRAMQSEKGFGLFQLLIGFFVFWMARRFFASIFDSMQNIFHAQTNRKAMKNQILTFVVETAIVFVVAAVIFAYISLNAISPFVQKIPALSFFFNGIFLKFFVNQLPNVLIFAVVLTMYKTVPGTHPQFLLCILAAFFCTFSFGIFRSVMHLFMNPAKYNLIYGMLGQAILAMMDIFFFFTFFLFFAQYIFVCQFFDTLLIGELYLLPQKEQANFFATAKRFLFIRPDFLLAFNENVANLSNGEKLFSVGDESQSVFYIVSGEIAENKNGKITIHSQGNFFGEIGCVLKKTRDRSAVSVGKTRVVKIQAKTFRVLVRQNPQIAHKILKQVSSYFDSFAFESE